MILLALACSAITQARPALAEPKRALPDYDGRGNEDQHAGSWALWIPRVILWPLYAVNEYVLRRPLGWLVRRSEADHWVETITDAVTFGPEDNYLLVPTALVDFGLQPSVGLYFAGDRMFHPKNHVRIHASTGGRDWLSVTVLSRYAWNDALTSIAARFEATRRPDYLFYGLGPSATEATKSRYGLQRLNGALIFRQKTKAESVFVFTTGVRAIAFRPGVDPALDERVSSGQLPMPPGFDMPYTDVYQRGEIVLDERAKAPAPGSGAYLRFHTETNFDVKSDHSWIGYGALVGAAVDLTGHQRNVKLSLGVDFVDPIGGGGENIPFTELAMLGSDTTLRSDLMPGFVTGWMTGRSTFVSQLGYTWPVWTSLSGEVHFGMGNAFGEHLEDMTTRKLRMSGDIGITTSDERDAGFEVLFGLGTETIEDGAGVTSVRLLFGSRRGF